jgi:hypothetical protein
MKQYVYNFFVLLLIFQCSKTDDSIISDKDFIDSLSITYIVKKPDSSVLKILKNKEQSLDTVFSNEFNECGTYKLEISYSFGKRIFDTLFYDFDIIGEELYIDFYFSLSLSKKVDYYYNKKKEMHGYLNICKYYNNLEGVSLELKDQAVVNKCPVFLLTNNSQDTLFGKYLPGYFWGSISIMDDGEWSDPNFFTIDLRFRKKDPLLPNDSAFATIGSFSDFNIASTGKYKFILHYSTSYVGMGVSYYKSTKHTALWADTKEFRVIEYEFEVE